MRVGTSNPKDQASEAFNDLENKITQHPFLKTFSKVQRSAMAVNRDVPDVDKALYEKLSMQFINFLSDNQGVESLLLKHINRNAGVHYKEEAGEGPGRRSAFKTVLDDPSQYVKPRSDAFDSVAYMEAIWDCIRAYDPDYTDAAGRKPSFLGLFSKAYANRLKPKRQEQINIYTGKFYTILPRETRKMMVSIVDCVKRKHPSYTPETLPEKFYAQVAKETNLSVDQVRKIIRLIWIGHPSSLDAPLAGDEGDSLTIDSIVPDPGPGAQEMLEKSMKIFLFAQSICSLTLNAYNRILMSNLLLRPLHPVEKAPRPVAGDDENYVSALIENRKELYQAAFALDYLQFVEWRRPDDSLDGPTADVTEIQVLCYGYPMRPLIDKTVAEFKHVTPANITHHKKTFNSLLKGAAALAFES